MLIIVQPCRLHCLEHRAYQFTTFAVRFVDWLGTQKSDCFPKPLEPLPSNTNSQHKDRSEVM